MSDSSSVAQSSYHDKVANTLDDIVQNRSIPNNTNSNNNNNSSSVVVDEDKPNKPQHIKTGGVTFSTAVTYNTASNSSSGTPPPIPEQQQQQQKQQPLYPRDLSREYISIQDDVYNMFFLGPIGGHAFWYFIYIYILKLSLYTFLILDVMADVQEKILLAPTAFVITTQFLIIPVAVAMQDDLTATFFLIANIKYCPSVQNDNPDASEFKYYIATVARAVDGSLSLLINFVVLMTAESVLSLFLNFAALQFLQTIDNIAVELAADGFLSDTLQDMACNVQDAQLPKRGDDNWMRSLDTVMFVATILILLVVKLYFAIDVLSSEES